MDALTTLVREAGANLDSEDPDSVERETKARFEDVLCTQFREFTWRPADDHGRPTGGAGCPVPPPHAAGLPG